MIYRSNLFIGKRRGEVSTSSLIRCVPPPDRGRFFFSLCGYVDAPEVRFSHGVVQVEVNGARPCGETGEAGDVHVPIFARTDARLRGEKYDCGE